MFRLCPSNLPYESILRDRPTAFTLPDNATGVYGEEMLNALA